MLTFINHCRTRGRNVLRRWQRLAASGLQGQSPVRIPETDYYRLLRACHQRKKTIKPSCRLKFRYMMSRAMMMPIRLIGSDVVTMNTDMVIRTAAGKRLFVRLVYPEWKDRSKNWISVFSWAGLSLLGRKKGDTIRRGLTIDKIIYQPESNNDFHL
jgi:hypothetical protein